MADQSNLSAKTMREQEFLRHQGYFRAREVFDQQAVEQAKAAIFNYFGVDQSSALTSSEHKKPGALKQYQAAQTIPEVMSLITSERLLDVLEGFLGPNIAMPLNRHNHVTVNPPGVNTEGMHRDHGEPTRGLISAVIYLEDADAENGCTHVIPGSHMWATKGHAENGGYWLDDSDFTFMNEQAVPVPMEAGDVLFFDAHIFHGVGQNNSNRTRTSIAIGYHSVDQLADSFDHEKLLVVRGSERYRGNDR